ncbi:MAG TPA: metallophosphoesterase family protein [Anaerolineales bacterium]|nr:metallophosphoesterase family protein [Anaerolineales bacterium]
MRVAVFSDTHGSCYALNVMLEDLRKQSVDGMVCLGDAIQGGPQPAELVRRLRELNCPTVMGNSDAWLLSGVETDAELISEERRQKLNLVREWSLSKLSLEDRSFMETFQPTISIPLGSGRTLLCFHGSPDSFDQFILPSTPENEFQELLKPYADNILAGGHMHLQFTRRLRDSQNFFFNPGSVGVAYNHEQSGDKGYLDPWAEYAILTVEGRQVSLEFRRIPLDMDQLADIYRHSDRPFAESVMEQYTKYE